ncbi:uncharacterized protein B0P05DRAFT_635165 [Gilbertella persicaria]|uniref:uncharacterized protein n=1 Tax=Gilbertella persicaria TaxID=101096 RepID=UPI002221288D|nr:uncharacterized protein B0P05DRAFT_635165 [Gilbertella persicaria]KAI8087941.1 hypothetical protein B0P05DRAFT_635165 [Gilbertella persicaria]
MDRNRNDNQENIYYSDQQKNIPIPVLAANNHHFDMSTKFQDYYDDIMSYTSGYLYTLTDSEVSLNALLSEHGSHNDPLSDPQFMAFLSSVPTHDTTSHVPLLTPQEVEKKTKGTKNPIHPVKKCTPKPNQRKSTSTKLGHCEHPKHVYYRQERHLLMSNSPDEASVMKAVPRRGRPPKGSKSTEYVLSTSSVHYSHEFSYYPLVELTVRPLPKRLEAVVGKPNIKVCLTCLKRSDTDPDYLKDALYVGPQQQAFKRRKE